MAQRRLVRSSRVRRVAGRSSSSSRFSRSWRSRPRARRPAALARRRLRVTRSSTRSSASCSCSRSPGWRSRSSPSSAGGSTNGQPLGGGTTSARSATLLAFGSRSRLYVRERGWHLAFDPGADNARSRRGGSGAAGLRRRPRPRLPVPVRRLPVVAVLGPRRSAWLRSCCRPVGPGPRPRRRSSPPSSRSRSTWASTTCARSGTRDAATSRRTRASGASSPRTASRGDHAEPPEVDLGVSSSPRC